MPRSWPRSWTRSKLSVPRSGRTGRRGDLRRHQTRATGALILVHTSAKVWPARLPDRGSPRAPRPCWPSSTSCGTEAMRSTGAQPRRGCARFRRWFAKAQRTSLNQTAAVPPRHDGRRRALHPAAGPGANLILHRRDVSLSRSRRAATWPSTSPGQAGRAARSRRDAGLGDAGTRPGPDPAVPDRRPPAHRAQSGAGHRAVFRHRRLHRTRRPAGDRRWRELLNVHDELARRLVEEFGGRLVKTTGDGLLPPSTEQPRRSAARPPSETSWAASASSFGWLHTGEVELRDGDVGGIAVRIAARVMAAARPGEILVLQDRAGPDRGLRHRLGRPRHAAVAGRRGYLAAVRGGGAYAVPSGDRHVPSVGPGAGAPTFRSEAGQWGSSADADGEVLEPGRVLDCHLDLVLDQSRTPSPPACETRHPKCQTSSRNGPLAGARAKSLTGADRNPAPAEAASWLWRPSRWAIAAASWRPATPAWPGSVRRGPGRLGRDEQLLPAVTPDVRYVNAGTSTLRNSSKSFLGPDGRAHRRSTLTGLWWPTVRRRTRHRVVAPDADT